MSNSQTFPGIPGNGIMPAPRPGWFIALGIVFILLGALAWIDAVAATLASTVVIGLLLVLAGVVQLAHAIAHRGTGARGALLPGLLGVLYILAGITIVEEPINGSLLITAFLAGCLIIAGIVRIVWAAGHRGSGGWSGLLLSGVVALVIGVVVYESLPWSGLWLLGTVVAAELIIGGIAMLIFGVRLRRGLSVATPPR